MAEFRRGNNGLANPHKNRSCLRPAGERISFPCMTISNPKSVIVPVDFSDASFDAVRVAVEMAGSPSNVHVIHVVPEALSSADYLREAMTQQGPDKALSELTAKLAASGLSDVHASVEEGIPSEAIAAKASSEQAELIVIPSHSRKGIPRLFLGSVADQVLRAAACPVLVLKR